MALTAIVLVLALAGFVQGVTGFGFGMVAMTLLPMVMDFRAALAVVTVLNLPACVVTWLGVRQHFVRDDGLRLMFGSLVGAPVGFLVIVQMPRTLVLRVLGAVVATVSLAELLRRRPHLPRSACFAIGILSGALGGALNMGAPPLVAYVYAQPWTKEQTVAVLQAVFLANGLVRLALLALHGEVRTATWFLVAIAAGPMLAANVLGTWLFQRVSQDHLRVIVFTGLLLVAMKYLLMGQ
jgi:uncharacterized membrane protein YfcA